MMLEIKMRRLLGTVLLGLRFLGAGLQAHAAAVPVAGIGEALGLDPRWNWQTLETPTFRITFPAELADVANRSANYFEEAQALLGPKLLWKPLAKVQVLVIDNSDAANGLTSPVLRVGMVLMVTPPEEWFSTAYYDDWLRLLVIHEYAHFLNMDATQGLWTSLRWIFGDVFLPNGILPSWMLEGLAVYIETHYTKAGRGRSAFYEGLLRVSVEEGTLGTSNGVTLDVLNGVYPYFPWGETQYMFGYQLTNEVARQQEQVQSEERARRNDGEPLRNTADGELALSDGDSALGMLSLRSAGRVPFFINGNLKNVVGRDWYDVWDKWLAQTRERAQADIARIKSQPLSQPEIIIEGQQGEGHKEILGSAVSPDGSWLAWTESSSDRRMGLWLRDLRTGKTRRLLDKSLGAGVSFSPDSETLFFSALRRNSNYTTFSDLGAFDLVSGETHWLTEGLRARDPQISTDGKWIVFTLTQKVTTGIAIAPLLRDGRHHVLGPVESVFLPEAYDRASGPRFRKPDGSEVVFSLHRNGKASVELFSFERDSRKLTLLVENGHFNRYPAVSKEGDVYFISDLTGVDNLYRFRGPDATPEMVSNVLGGLWFASLDSEGRAYASMLSSSGWKLVRLPLLQGLSPEKATVAGSVAPSSIPAATAEASWPVSEYSMFPSIWPRQWAPFLTWGPRMAYFGGQVLGFDAVDRHRYVLGLAYNTQLRKADWFAEYTNRSFWPTLTISGFNNSSSVTSYSSFLEYSRRLRASVRLSRDFLWTYSSLTPSVAVNADRTQAYRRDTDADDGADVVINNSRYVPNLDVSLFFSNGETSRLAITTEGGRSTLLSARRYIDPESPSWKGLFIDREYFRITEHSVLSPQLKASWTSRINPAYSDAAVLVQGSLPGFFEGSSDSLDQLEIRGYPDVAFYTRGAVVGTLNYSFPITRVFRGIGTYPVFFEQLSGFVFGESAYLPDFGRRFGVTSFPSAGAGLKFSTTIFYNAPLNFTLEYDYGFRKRFGGTGEIFASFGLGAFRF